MKLKFLGTGGGRYVTGEQVRRTAGIVVKTGETQVHVDPGPGALVYAHQELEQPLETEALMVSHAHLDHANDAQAMVEMMTMSGNKPGAVFANETVLRGYSDMERFISNYHQDLCQVVETLEDGSQHGFKDLDIRSQQMFHGDPKTQGFVLEDDENTIGFWTDTEFSEELLEFYEGCSTLVVYCTRPRGKGIANHTSTGDIPEIVEAVEPNTVIATHFGYAMIDAGLEDEEKWLEEQVDAKVVFAEDGMSFPGNRRLGDF